MPINYHLLLIEDEPEKWTSLFAGEGLDPEKDAILVETVTALEPGKDAIRKNHLDLDAVLIEYNFPDVSPEVILDFLFWKRNQYPNLPAFILCANPSSEDISIITRFIRAGAVNYFNIANFKTAYLTAHLWAAHENVRIQQRYDVVAKPVSGGGPIQRPELVVHAVEGSQVSGTFAYVLEAVKKPRTNEEEAEFTEYAERWHLEFFRMLALVIDPQVTLSLRYLRHPRVDQETPATVGVYWCFTIKAGDPDELYREYENNIRDINLYLGMPSSHPNNPFVVSPVTDHNLLKTPGMQKGMNHFRIRRKAVPCGTPVRRIGYRERPGELSAHVLSVFQKPEEWSSINTFCKILAQEAEGTEFSITVTPGRLNERDKTEASRWAAGLPENFPLRNEEAGFYQKFLEGLSRGTFKPFTVSFQLVTRDTIPNDAIKAALYNTFALEKFEDWNAPESGHLFENIYPDSSLLLFARMPLPQKEGIPGITTIRQNLLYLPANIHKEGVLIGRKTGKSQVQNIRISYSDLAQHAYILGQTGTGKSTMLYTMVMDMLKSGRHVSLIDPHGDLYDQVVQNLPDSCRSNTVLFDPSSLDDLPGINFLKHDPADPFQKSFLLNAMYGILDNLYDMKLTGGPIFIKYLQAAMKLVLAEGGSLLDVIRVFESSSFRNELLENITDPELRAEWREIDSSGGETSFANISVYITSKLNEFRNNSFIREILRSKENQVDFGDIMNNGRNLLVRLPIGTLGERGVNLVGQIIFNKFLMTAFAREKMAVDKRLDHVLVVDEFHKFTTDALGKVFSEARKYHLSLIVANQTFSQLNQEVQHLLLGNVGSMLFFRPGINDAQMAARYFEPDFEARELCNLPNYHCAARISINHKPSRPFVFETIPFEPGDQHNAEDQFLF